MKIELRNISFRYENKEPLFKKIQFSTSDKDYVAIQGGSGVGKSSLLRLMNRLLEPSAGEVLVDDMPINTYKVTELRRKIVYLQQTPIMIEGSVEKNLLLPFDLASSTQPAPRQEELRKWLDDLLLKDVQLHNDANKLSVGQKQRIAFIRCLLLQPKLLLCDEPTSALDPQAKEILERCLENCHLERKTGIVLVTHSDVISKKTKIKKYLLNPYCLKDI